ncbi:putative NBD/HSP70 family sugar kinase [Salinibacterium sp. CAN_S4]|uniref:ROK family protein n=1 Tax=Salinibacterium sp. CAN_S4 TaxID=2787727 RepID=UPI0018EF795A
MPDHQGRSDNARRRNLAAVLQLVHRGSGPSRAELTAVTGLNRSTIGDLVAELTELGLVRESDALSSNRVGRPSPLVHPDPRPVIIALNPEVDSVTAAVVGLGARVEHRVRREVDHPLDPEEMTAVIAELVREMREASPDRHVHAVGLAVPGLVRSSDGTVRWAPHLEWREVPITTMVANATGLPTYADNDASLGAVAERLFGAGRGVDELVYLNGGASGIGGGVVVRGIALSGVRGYAGEFGQNRPGLGDPGDRTTQYGTLEDEVSRARLLEVVGLESADEPQLRDALLASSDPAVHSELARQQRILSVALGNAINVFNPELVVLGGFLDALLAWDAALLCRGIREMTVAAAWEDVTILPAALGENRLLIGAAELAFTAMLRDPAAAR